MDRLEDLIAAHPRLFQGVAPSAPSSVPSGWFALTDKLCSDIEALVEPEPERCEVTQIKETFGGLRVYFELDGVKDEFVDRPEPEGVTTSVTRTEGSRLVDAIRELLAVASERSMRMCQECGATGTCVNRGGWLSTLCERHAVHLPRATVTREDLERQRMILTTPRRTCTVVIEYVDSNIGLADGRDEVSAKRVSLNSNTTGVDWKTLQVGSRLVADVTALNHAVSVRLAEPRPR